MVQLVTTAALPSGVMSQHFESAEIAIDSVNAGSYSAAHSLGVVPRFCMAVLRCITAENGYVEDDEVFIASTDSAADVNVMAIACDATDVEVLQANDIQIPNRSTPGTVVNPTNANWKIVLRAWA